MKIPSFDGKKESYSRWLIRVLAFARVKNFAEALYGREDALPSSKDEVLSGSAEDIKKAKEAIRRNAITMSYLTIAFSTNTLLNKITNAGSVNWPGGLAYELMESLSTEYQPTDDISHAIMLGKLMSMKLGKT